MIAFFFSFYIIYCTTFIPREFTSIRKHYSCNAFARKANKNHDDNNKNKIYIKRPKRKKIEWSTRACIVHEGLKFCDKRKIHAKSKSMKLFKFCYIKTSICSNKHLCDLKFFIIDIRVFSNWLISSPSIQINDIN